MKTIYYNPLLASTYGGCSYGDSGYQNGQNCTATGTGGGGTSGTGSGGSTGSQSALTNTGIAIAAVVAVAALILLAAMIVRIWKRPSRKQSGTPPSTPEV